MLCSGDFVKQHGLEAQAVEVVAMELATDLPSTFEEESCMKMVRRVVTNADVGKGSPLIGWVLVKDRQCCELLGNGRHDIVCIIG